MTETAPANRLGCARVSTYGQTLDAQLEQLRGDGCRTIFREKASRVQANRWSLGRSPTLAPQQQAKSWQRLLNGATQQDLVGSYTMEERISAAARHT